MENLEAKSVAELEALARQVEAALEVARAREKAEVLEEMQALAESRGFSLEELLGKAKKSKARKAVAIKYQDPSDASSTWTGRGKKPKWLEAYLGAGRNIEDFAV